MTLEIFTELHAGCSGTPLKLGLNMGGPSCLDLPEAGMALGSKRLDVDASPGPCSPSGGELVGDVEFVEPSTFCCVGSPDAGKQGDATRWAESARRYA